MTGEGTSRNGRLIGGLEPLGGRRGVSSEQAKLLRVVDAARWMPLSRAVHQMGQSSALSVWMVVVLARPWHESDFQFERRF